MKVIRFISKYRFEAISVIFLAFLYFATRLPNLLNFPIFTDEAIYVRWTQIALNDANWRFISLTDGKQPSFIWAGMVFLKLFQEPLLSLRLVSVVSGLFTMAGLFLLTFYLFKSKKAAFLSVLIYIVFPFAVVYDRLALYDSLLSAFVIWSLYFAVLLIRKIRLDMAFLLGFSIGGAMLTKSSGVFSVYLLPLTLLLFDFKDKNWKMSIIRWILFAFFAVLIAFGLSNVIKLSPFAHIITEKNTIFVAPISEWIKNPFGSLEGNLKGLLNWLFTYLTPFFAFLIFISLITIKKYTREKLLLLAYFILPFTALAIFGRVLFPRFILFMAVVLIPLVSIGLIEIIDKSNKFFKNRKINNKYVISGLIILFFLLFPAKISLDFIFSSKDAKIADADIRQYITDWPSGVGISESIDFFEKEAQDKRIFIATQGTFGLLPYAYEIYLSKNQNVQIKGYWPIEQFPEELLSKGNGETVYFVFYQPCPGCEFPGDHPDEYPLKLIKKFEKSDNTYLSIYEITQ